MTTLSVDTATGMTNSKLNMSPTAGTIAPSASQRTKTMNDMIDVPRWALLLGIFAIGNLVADILRWWF